MKAKPPVPMRQKTWYAVLWLLLLLGSGAWTARMAYVGYQLSTQTSGTVEPGSAAMGAQAVVIFSIPIYVLFLALLLCIPERAKKQPRPIVRK
jgi:hypothetical protein